MSYTASKLLAIAADEIGYHEKASNASLDDKTANSGSNNWTKYARDLANAGYYNGNKNGFAWCDVFCDWCFYQLAEKDPVKAQWIECQTGPYGAGCIFSSRYYREAGRFSSLPAKGAQIFFGAKGNEEHTGLVEGFDDIYVYTIEGNSSDQVIRRTYRKDNPRIVGYGIPRFDEDDNIQQQQTAPTKSIEQLAQEVLDGKWGSGDDRIRAITAAGYNYTVIQAKVNEMLQTANANEAQPSTEYVKGIDVSVWNGDLNWAKIKADGYKFAIIRSSYRQTTDTRFIQNITQANLLNIPVGIYHFSYALNVEQAKQEADYVINLIKPYKVQLPIFFDFEYDTISKAAAVGVTLGRTEFNNHAVAFLEKIKAAGYIPGIYYNFDYYNRMVDKEKLGKYFIWYAQYASSTSIQNFDMWQHSSEGKISGHGNTNFDLNKMKIESWNKLFTNQQVQEDEENMNQVKFNEMMNAWIETQAAKTTDASWSAEAREWAEKNKYIQGDEKNRKMYKKYLTREEFVTVLYRILGKNRNQ